MVFWLSDTDVGYGLCGLERRVCGKNGHARSFGDLGGDRIVVGDVKDHVFDTGADEEFRTISARLMGYVGGGSDEADAVNGSLNDGIGFSVDGTFTVVVIEEAADIGTVGNSAG